MKSKETVLHALKKFGLLPEEEEVKVCFFYQMTVPIFP